MVKREIHDDGTSRNRTGLISSNKAGCPLQRPLGKSFSIGDLPIKVGNGSDFAVKAAEPDQ